GTSKNSDCTKNRNDQHNDNASKHAKEQTNVPLPEDFPLLREFIIHAGQNSGMSHIFIILSNHPNDSRGNRENEYPGSSIRATIDYRCECAGSACNQCANTCSTISVFLRSELHKDGTVCKRANCGDNLSR